MTRTIRRPDWTGGSPFTFAVYDRDGRWGGITSLAPDPEAAAAEVMDYLQDEVFPNGSLDDPFVVVLGEHNPEEFSR